MKLPADNHARQLSKYYPENGDPCRGCNAGREASETGLSILKEFLNRRFRDYRSSNRLTRNVLFRSAAGFNGPGFTSVLALLRSLDSSVGGAAMFPIL